MRRQAPGRRWWRPSQAATAEAAVRQVRSRTVFDVVAEPSLGLDGVGADSAPQAADKNFDRIRVTSQVLRIDMLSQLELRDNGATVIGEVGEHLVLLRSELDRDTVAWKAHQARIDRKRPER